MIEVIQILGWVFLAITIILLVLAISEGLEERAEKKRIKNYYKTAKDVGDNIHGCNYWLNKPKHAPYREFFLYMVDRIRESGTIRGDDLRDKVNEIIENQTKEKE